MRLPCHNWLNIIIKRSLTSANILSVLEPEGLSCSDDKHPDGMTITSWAQGQLLFWNATCWDTASNIDSSGQPNPAEIRTTVQQYRVQPSGKLMWVDIGETNFTSNKVELTASPEEIFPGEETE